MKEMNVSEGCAIIPPEAAKKEIPYIVSWVALGAQCHVPYRDKKDVVGLELNGEWMMVSMKDWELAAKIHDQIDSSRAGNTMSGHEMLQWHRMATALAEKQFFKPRKSVVMTKDKGSAGYWRMILPAKHMQGDFRVDISAAEVKFDYLLEYDTVFVQRVHDWESFYILEKLKKAGKRIIYDIDDDLFSITPDNPAFYVIGRDNQQAAAACMKLAHEVTVTTALLAHRLAQVVGDIEPIVIPNAMDPDDRWLPTDRTGSPDEWKRIFWQGGASHAEDWMECIEAVDDVMKWRSDVRLVILGFLPPCIQERVNLPEYKNRIEFMGFSDPETYFEMMHHVRADVGLAPLRTSQFNSGKSPIKFIEHSVVGIPTVASYTEPYESVIEEGVNGLLVADKQGWVEAIEQLLTDADVRRKMVDKARATVREQFDIKEVAEQWQKVLLP